MADVTKLIERLEAFEDRQGVRLESLSADFELDGDTGRLIILGELHPQSGAELQKDVELVVAAYESSSKIAGTDHKYFAQDTFFGFEVFRIIVDIRAKELTRVRVYPKTMM